MGVVFVGGGQTLQILQAILLLDQSRGNVIGLEEGAVGRSREKGQRFALLAEGLEADDRCAQPHHEVRFRLKKGGKHDCKVVDEFSRDMRPVRILVAEDHKVVVPQQFRDVLLRVDRAELQAQNLVDRGQFGVLEKVLEGLGVDLRGAHVPDHSAQRNHPVPIATDDFHSRNSQILGTVALRRQKEAWRAPSLSGQVSALVFRDRNARRRPRRCGHRFLGEEGHSTRLEFHQNFVD
mmetsp:Transcript_5874/g.14294  ORF Transcript_5874/g.14294 Transcript_5874/m.14294 type:complete len:236 (+) Transcript_5874:494-1201(+)